MNERDFAFLCFAIICLLGFSTVAFLVCISFRSNTINPKYICRCDKGIYRPDGSMVWNEGSKYALKEKFYKCDHCGRVVSDQWPEQW